MKKILAGAAALALFTGAAEAADLYQPQALEPIAAAPEVTVEEESSGWYLRGDVGYSFNKLRGIYSRGGDLGPQEHRFDSAKIRDSAVLGGGVGYKINHYLRTDLTLDHFFKSNFKGSLYKDGVAFNNSSSVKGWGLMANAYVDLGTFSGITPYVGAGIGGTHVNWNNVKTTGTHDNGWSETASQHGKDSWRFTYALMAGASIDVTCNVKADVGYRFRHVTGGEMFGYKRVGPGRDRGFNNHEIRLGARYQFGGCETPVAYDPPAEAAIFK